MIVRRARGHRIVDAVCAPDSIVLDGESPRAIERALAGCFIRGAGRHGKYLWLELDRRPWPVFHFGMAGSIHLVPSPAANPPRFAKLTLFLDRGVRLVFTDARRLGRLRLRIDPRREPPIDSLGPDVWRETPTLAAMRDALSRRRAPIKSVLLDQSEFAGVGNWIADELLYASRIAPSRLAASLDGAEVLRLRNALRRVIGRAVSVDANSARFPRTWLFHRRWGKKAHARDASGAPLSFATVGGRTTAWVPSRQNSRRTASSA
jgi:formamidopyrimidine-DNA glycosylase